jgi:hypothetical protein
MRGTQPEAVIWLMVDEYRPDKRVLPAKFLKESENCCSIPSPGSMPKLLQGGGYVFPDANSFWSSERFGQQAF